MDFSTEIIDWYHQNKRKLPWRNTQDPYYIWLSEVILQQTRVNQGLPYYLKFIEAFPTVYKLAQADEQQVLKLWQGLGYYSRARNLHSTAKTVVEKYGGIFPKTYRELLSLKGIGEYTAAAITSIAFNEPQAVVDGNVYRVLSRIYGIKTPIDSSAGKKEFKHLAQQLLHHKKPGIHNQAVMEFGAKQCVPVKPDCSLCIFSENCYAFRRGEISLLPIKTGKPRVQQYSISYFVLISEDEKILLKKRTNNGIWKNLYEFPHAKTEAIKPLSLKQIKEKLSGVIIKNAQLYNRKPIVHKLSHRHLYIYFWIIRTSKLPPNAISIEQIEDYPVPVIIQKFITNVFPSTVKN